MPIEIFSEEHNWKSKILELVYLHYVENRSRNLVYLNSGI